jgi:hypothetical protein
MFRDELDERLRRAAKPEPADVDRIVTAVLAEDGDVVSRATSLRRFSPAIWSLAACLVVVAALGAWRYVHQEARPAAAGVYRVEAVSAARPGTYVAEAVPPPGPSRVLSVKADDGVTWIFSTTPDDDWLPAGESIVIGVGESR